MSAFETPAQERAPKRSKKQQESYASTRGMPASLHRASQQEQRHTWEDFCERLDVMGPDERVASLEAFLGNGTVSEAEVVPVVQRLSPEEHVELAFYLVDVLKPGVYPRVFYKCWPSLPGEIQRELFIRFTIYEAEGAILVAPFADVTRVPKDIDHLNWSDKMKRRAYLREKYIPGWIESAARYGHEYASGVSRKKEQAFIEQQKQEDPELISAVERHYNHFEAAKRLFEICLEENPKSCRPLFDYYRSRQPDFVFPYIPRLIQAGVCKVDDLTETVRVMTERYARTPDFFVTTEERERKQELLQLLQREAPVQADYAHQVVSELKNLKTRQAALERQRLDDEATKRSLDHAFGATDQFTDLLDTQAWDQMLLKMLENNFPVCYVLARVPFTLKQANLFLSRAIQQESYVWSLSGLEDLQATIVACGEERVANVVLQVFKESDNAEYIVQRIFRQLPTMLSWFSPKQRDRIVTAIGQHRPALWLRRFDYALEHKTISLPKLIKTAESDPELFLGQFDRVLRYARVTEADPGRAAFLSDRLRETARDCVDEHPIYFFRYAALMTSLFSAAERERFIVDHLAVAKPDVRFLHELTYEDRPPAARMIDRDLLRVAVVRDPAVFAELLERQRHDETLIELLGDQEFEKRFFAVLNQVDFENITSTSGTGLSRWLLAHPRRLERFLLELEPQDEDLAKLAQIMKSASDVVRSLRFDADGQKDQKKKIAQLQEVAVYQTSLQIIQQAFTRRLSLQPDLCFTKEVWQVHDLPDPYIPWQRVDALLERFPEAFEWIQQRLDKDESHPYVEKYARFLAFGSKKGDCIFRQDKLLESDVQQLYTLNPLLQSKEQSADEDYYQAVLDKLEDKPFFHFYEKRLRALASAEMERNGVQVASKVWKVQREFESLARRVGLLAACPFAVRYEARIGRLTEPALSDALRVFELVSLFGLDRYLDEDDLFGQELIPYLTQRVRVYLFDVLELGDVAGQGEALTQLSSEAIQAFITYSRGTCQTTKGMKAVLQEVFRQAAAGTYEDWRAWGMPDPGSTHGRTEALQRLKQERLVPEGMTLDAYLAWCESDSLDLETVLDVSIADVTGGIRSVLGQAVADHHVSVDTFAQSTTEVTEAYEQLFLPLSLLNERIMELRGILGGGRKRQEDRPEQQELDRLTEEFRAYREQHQEALDRLKALSYIHQFRVLSAKELEEKTLTIDKAKVPFAQAFKMIEKVFAAAPDFYQDVQRVKILLQDAQTKMFGGERISRSKLRLTDAVDVGVAIRIGEIPVPSCQHYASDSVFRGYNRGLLSYVSDPAVKIIQIYDEKNQLITRAILRLLQDDEGRSQLFLERVYSTNNHHKIREAVVQFARKKAKQMGVGLYSHQSETDDLGLEAAEVKTLHSRGSRNTHIYTDAGGGLMSQGVFSIRRAYQIG